MCGNGSAFRTVDGTDNQFGWHPRNQAVAEQILFGLACLRMSVFGNRGLRPNQDKNA